MQWRKSETLHGQVLHTERNKTYWNITRNYTWNCADKTNYSDMMKGGFMHNYIILLFIVLTERKIQRKFQIGSSLATLMQWCTYILKPKEFTKVKTFFFLTNVIGQKQFLGWRSFLVFTGFNGHRFSTKICWRYLCPNQKTAGEVWISKLQRKRRFLLRSLNGITSLRKTQNQVNCEKPQIHYLYALPKWGIFRKCVPFHVAEFVRMVVRVWLSYCVAISVQTNSSSLVLTGKITVQK